VLPSRSIPRLCALARVLAMGVTLPALALGAAACGSAAQPAAGASSSSSGYGAAAATSAAATKQQVLQGSVNATAATSPPPLAGPATAWKTGYVTAADQPSDVLRGADSWPGAKSDSFQLYAMWDAKDLYLGAAVVQDHPYSNAYSGGDVWKGDALWFYFTKAPGDHSNAAKLTLVQASDGPEVYDWIGNQLVTNVQMKLVSADNHYWVAGAIPWSDLGVTPKAGAQLGINVGFGFGSSGFIDLNGKDPDSDTSDDPVLTLLAPGK
jgi:hypothetical protein